ncbi:MAG: tetratricopeptide repeat protein [bacterium]
MISELSREDYLEPRCLLCEDPIGVGARVKSIPQRRVVQKLDEYMSRRDYAGAERHLLYWLAEAQAGGDEGGELLVRNELVGHYRKTGEREKANEQGERALCLVDKLGLTDSVSAATTYTNVATALSAFGEHAVALALFEKARFLYENQRGTSPDLLGGLYNNMALTSAALGRYEAAHALFRQAMAVMERVPGGELEQAITCLNRADALEAEKGYEAAEKEICALLDEAEAFLEHTAAPRDGYYAFVCEKCAPGFAHYGYFLTAETLRDRAESIYAGA